MMETTCLGLGVPRCLLSAHGPTLALCACSRLLQEEAPLMVPEQGTHLGI